MDSFQHYFEVVGSNDATRDTRQHWQPLAVILYHLRVQALGKILDGWRFVADLMQTRNGSSLQGQSPMCGDAWWQVQATVVLLKLYRLRILDV